MSDIPQRFLEVIKWMDPEAKGATSAVAVWLTPADKVLGFNINVAPEDRALMAQRLHELATTLVQSEPLPKPRA